MPRPKANVTVVHAGSWAAPGQHAEDAAKVCAQLGMSALPPRFMERLGHLIGACRQAALRQTPTPGEAQLALQEVAEAAGKLAGLLGQPGDYVAEPLASLARTYPGGLSAMRVFQRACEDMQAAVKCRRPGRSASELSAKVTMAAGIAELLANLGIDLRVTLEPPSAYVWVVRWGIHRAGLRGDPGRIALEGLAVWRGWPGT